MTSIARATIFVVALMSILSIPRGLAYDENTTHPALTQEIVKFYNLSYPDKPITLQEAEWIIQGSIDEDAWPRWINHFYDPINQVGWSGEKAGSMPAAVVQAVSGSGLSIESPMSSVEWVNSYLNQASYSRYGGNRTWKKGLEYYGAGDKEQAYLTLGHALHLLEDMSVPEHTRNDTHAHDLQAVTGDTGSPYEEYTKKWTRSTLPSLDIPNQLKNAGMMPIGGSSITDHLISLAQYSNKYFFTKDTINDSKYVLPKIVKEENKFGYGDQGFPLVRIKKVDDGKFGFKSLYFLEQTDYEILDEYFSHLSRQAILHGADVIRLFKAQGEDEMVNKDFPNQLVQVDADVYAKLFPNFSLATEIASFSSRVSGWGQTAVRGVAGAFSTIKGFFISSPGANVSDSFSENGNEGVKRVEGEKREETGVAGVLPDLAPKENGNGVNNGSNGNEKSATQQNTFTLLQAQIDSARNALGSIVQNLPVKNNLDNGSKGNNGGNGNEGVKGGSLPDTFRASGGQGGGGGGVTSAPAPVVEDSNGGNGVVDGNNGSTQIGSSTATSITQNATSTPTSTPAVVSPLATHVVVSEIQVAGAGGSGDEFVELYNPTNADVDISNWSIQYVSGQATSTQSVLRKNFGSTSTVPAFGFFLVARAKNSSNADGYTGSKPADLTHRTFSMSGGTEGGVIFLTNTHSDITSESDASIIDRVAYGAIIQSSFAEGSSSAPLPSASSSIVRKAVSNTTCVDSTSSPQVTANKFLGNGCDSDMNGNDFELLAISDPQNAASLPEPRTAPTPQNARATFASSSMQITFSWDSSSDARGATSTNTYRLYDLSNSTTTLKGTTTSSAQIAFGISEVGRDYPFSFVIEDKDGMTASATSTLSVPGFFSNAYFYRDTSNDVFDMRYASRPFIPGIFSISQYGSPLWQGLVLYFNHSANGGNRFLDTPGGFNPSDTTGVTKTSIFAIDASNATGFGGGLRNSSFLLPSDGQLKLPLSTNATTTTSDYLTVGYYDFCQSGGGVQTLCIVATDATQYLFSAVHP